jgi:bifunctional DNA-binding transcriptional regulator/antitoxin component of YhaV-PrlF toxin-antitoxin module
MNDTTFAIAKMSTKGQIVIPKDMREEFVGNDDFLLIKNQGKLIIKSMADVSKDVAEDLEFARRTEEAYFEAKKSKRKPMTMDAFVKKASKW